MRRVILKLKNNTEIGFSEIDDEQPIFAKRNGELIGMVVKDPRGWIVRIGNEYGANGYHDTLLQCLSTCEKQFSYEFFITEGVK